MKYCSNCGNPLNSKDNFCQNCGSKSVSYDDDSNATIKNNDYVKEKISKSVPIIAIIIICIMFPIVLLGIYFEIGDKVDYEVDKNYVIYQGNDILVKIIGYEYKSKTDTIVVTIYIENNSDTDTAFTIDGDVSIDGYMVDGGYFYQIVNSNTKATEEFRLYNLKDSKLDGNKIKEMRCKFDIYQTKDYFISNRILDDGTIIYRFK